jgi:hypothetical protein
MLLCNGVAVEIEERQGCRGCSTLVPVYERVAHRNRDDVRRRHVKEVQQILAGVCDLRGRGCSLKSIAVPKARLTACQLDFAAMDVEDILNIQEERLDHLLAELIQRLPMSRGDGFIGRIATNPSYKQSVLARHNLYHVISLDLEELEESLVEDQTAAVADLL